jgi:GlcNAc-P-P-Und epimerase
MILITGGSGFIGGHFHRRLDNKNLINFDLEKPTFKSSAGFVQGDLRKKEDVTRAMAGNNISCVLSLAAKHHDFGIGHDEYFDTNEQGTAILCQVASENNVKDIIFYSSVAVYGIRPEISNEEMSPMPDSPYGASKLAGEEVLKQWAAQDPTRKVLIIRPTIVFGPNNMANMKNLIAQIDSGLYFHLGAAANVKSIAYVENLVSATLYLKDKMKPGVAIYNYADEPQLSSREIADHIASFLGKKIRLTVPRPLGILMGLPFDLAIKITGKNLPISSARIKKLGTQTYHSAKKLFNEGFSAQYSTVQGLEKMVEWYQQEKHSR